MYKIFEDRGHATTISSMNICLVIFTIVAANANVIAFFSVCFAFQNSNVIMLKAIFKWACLVRVFFRLHQEANMSFVGKKVNDFGRFKIYMENTIAERRIISFKFQSILKNSKLSDGLAFPMSSASKCFNNSI